MEQAGIRSRVERLRLATLPRRERISLSTTREHRHLVVACQERSRQRHTVRVQDHIPIFASLELPL